MHICLDIDDTITYQPEFFAAITQNLAHATTTVVTIRADYRQAAKCLDELQVRYDHLIVSTDTENGKTEFESLVAWKARVVNALMPDVFFEDLPEVIALVDDTIPVFQPCNRATRSWMRRQFA